MTSFFAQIMEPGGGIMLLPFVRMVIGCLLALTTTTAILGVARIHMIILSFLSAGLLASLHFFESEVKRVRSYSSQSYSNAAAVTNDDGSKNKSD
jgi:ER protein Pkr1